MAFEKRAVTAEEAVEDLKDKLGEAEDKVKLLEVGFRQLNLKPCLSYFFLSSVRSFSFLLSQCLLRAGRNPAFKIPPSPKPKSGNPGRRHPSSRDTLSCGWPGSIARLC